MGSSDDDGPGKEVSLEIGVTGVIIFSILFVLAAVSLKRARNKYSWRMFTCSTLVTLLELPRYAALIVQRAYTNRVTYILHMWASVAFFAAFTCVIYIMHDAVDLSQAHSPLTVLITSPKSLVDRIVIDKTSMVAINLLFASLTLAASISCVLYHNLENFFHDSIVYRLFTLADLIKNLVIASAFLFYGCRLKARINAFYDTFGIEPAAGGSVSELDLLMKLRKVVRRLLIVMVTCLSSFLLRTVMLVIKGVCIEEETCSLTYLPHYGMLWWVLSDFIPRALPLAAFVVFFGQRSRRGGSGREHSKILYGGSAGALRGAAGADFDAENRRALLAELDGEEGPEGREYDDQDGSSTSGGSGHHNNHLHRAHGHGYGHGYGHGVERESVGSMESYETTSSSHTVYRTTATTSEFSSAYYPSYRGYGGSHRPSESMGYFGGSVIVNALMWPIGSSLNPYRSSSVGSVGGGGPVRTESVTSCGVPSDEQLGTSADSDATGCLTPPLTPRLQKNNSVEEGTVEV